jgi:hypothetical protein
VGSYAIYSFFDVFLQRLLSMSNPLTPEFTALSLGESTLYEILEQFCQTAQADVVNASQSVSQVIPQAGYALSLLRNAPDVLRTNLLTLLTERYRLYLGPVACHHRRVAHLNALSAIGYHHTQEDQRRQAEEFIQLHYPYRGSTASQDIQNLCAVMGPMQWQERSYGSNAYRRSYFHYPRTGPRTLGDRLLKRLLEIDPAGVSVLEGSCPEGSWAESVSGYSNTKTSVRGGLSINLNREGTTSSTTLRFELDHSGNSDRDFSLRRWHVSSEGVYVNNAMESTSYSGDSKNVDMARLHRVLIHYLQTVEPTLSLETILAYSPDKSPYVEATFTVPDAVMAFFQDPSTPDFPYKSKHFPHCKVRYSPEKVPYGTTPFIRLQFEPSGRTT